MIQSRTFFPRPPSKSLLPSDTSLFGLWTIPVEERKELLEDDKTKEDWFEDDEKTTTVIWKCEIISRSDLSNPVVLGSAAPIGNWRAEKFEQTKMELEPLAKALVYSRAIDLTHKQLKEGVDYKYAIHKSLDSLDNSHVAHHTSLLWESGPNRRIEPFHHPPNFLILNDIPFRLGCNETIRLAGVSMKLKDIKSNGLVGDLKDLSEMVK
eukprot:CAMPEP_0184340356 /NCGR_PEP_ID=MMETSP1089-20130417/9041_1 /TAXON_ID=38269 ORGANISM="Gloeochaete wittrockiana, Strain SAG46.84" /NCGR_SAMPLE_ID=MMETSP1089 /ASSEMBLY_ACC=CAM_ASM_000445 /LENGTH=208 /DNA_ID=CAMNT_0026668135 /DNA_START=138 /DNA_END=761 /DNA_ORIENTATION=-